MVDFGFANYPLFGVGLGPTYVIPEKVAQEQFEVGLIVVGIAAAVLLGLGIYVVETSPGAAQPVYSGATSPTFDGFN